MGSGLLVDLILRLLRGALPAAQHDVTSSNYQMYLRRLFRTKCQVGREGGWAGLGWAGLGWGSLTLSFL